MPFSTPRRLRNTRNNRKSAYKKGIISKEALKNAIIEEYVVGAKFNANYFWSPLTDEIDLLGFDRRIQTDLDGVLDLPAAEQLELNIPTQNIEIGHMGATMRESQLEKIFDAAERFVNTCKKEYPPGMIGLFALQGAVTKDLKFYVFDVSPRIPGCPVRRAHIALHEVQIWHGSRPGKACGHGNKEGHERGQAF